MDEQRRLLCSQCQAEMRPAKTSFSYLGHIFPIDLPRCPKCGRVYVPKELANGRMAEVEALLEDK